VAPETIRLVRSTFAQVLPVADLAVGLFYDRLFTLDPSLRRLFATDLEPQKHALMATLGLVIGYLDRPEELVPIVEQLGRRHAGYGIEAAHYATVGSALLWTLEQGLGPTFTPAVRAAWTEVYDLLATTMQAAASSTEPRTTGDEAPARRERRSRLEGEAHAEPDVPERSGGLGSRDRRKREPYGGFNGGPVLRAD
jgi:hemoglobin-like flavoprotein